MGEPLSFTTLDDDVIHLILEHLRSDSPRSMSQMSLVSKSVHDLANAILCRSIELYYGKGPFVPTIR